jgi:hypothetical protein
MERAARRYVLEFAAAMAAYAMVLAVSVLLLRGSAADGAIWRTPVALAPMLPAVAVLVAVVRQLGRIDELQRRIQFEALAFAFGGTALVTFSYGFLENVGYPHLTWFAVWPVMATLWLVGLAVARRRYA